MVTADRVRQVLHYNPDTGVFTWKETLSRRAVKGKVAGVVANNGYIHIGVDEGVYLAHRLAWLYVYGVWPTKEVDHINQRKTDNRISNLREVTRAENMQNRSKVRADNSTGATGVYWCKQRDRWLVKVSINGKTVQVGRYKDFDEAVSARKEAVKQHYIEGAA